MKEKEFERYMMLYGIDLGQWPETLQADALCASSSPAIEALVIRHQYFEETLLANDRIAPASADFADRILRAARACERNRNFSLMDWLGSLFADFSLPQPAYVATLVVLLGLSLGISDFGLPATSSNSEPFTLTDDGAAL